MKMLKMLVLLAVGVCLVPGSVLAATSSANSLEIVVPSGDFHLESGKLGARVVMDGFELGADPGKPMLPEKRVMIALPPATRVTGITASGIGVPSMREVGQIEPAPAILPLSGGDPVKLRAEWEAQTRAAFAAEGLFPREMARIVGAGSLRKYAYAAVSLSPVRYSPSSGRLAVYDAVRIVVHFEEISLSGDAVREFEALMADLSADDRAARLFVNHDEMKGRYRSGGSAGRSGAELYDYVIVTTDALAGAVSASGFTAWKTSLGFSVRTVLTSDPEISSQSGVDLAERIRNFLRSRYGSWGIQYVLFVGDYVTVPMRYCFPDPSDHTHDPGNYHYLGGSVPTDYYYADLSQSDALSWDSDGDGYHGEYQHDSPDLLAEVYVGRIPTSIPSRITYALDKMVAFEQDGGSWKDNALHPGSMLFFENQDYTGVPEIDGSRLLDHIETDMMGGWTVSHYSEREGLGSSSYLWPAVSMAAFADDWRTGRYGVVNWAGHGLPSNVRRTVWNWDDGDGVMETDGSDGISQPYLIDLTSNLDDDYPSIVFALSCNVGYPEPNDLGNLGIDLMTMPGFGAAAGIVCSSRPAYVSANYVTNPAGAEIIAYMFNHFGVVEGRRLGEAMYDGKFYCYLNYGWQHYAEFANQFNFDLYGDPSMARNLVLTGVEGDDAPGATFARLEQNVPNPFNPTTEIRYTVPAGGGAVSLQVFDVAGRLVSTLVDERQAGGRRAATWSGRDDGGRPVASGIYFYRLTVPGFVETRKMVPLQ